MTWRQSGGIWLGDEGPDNWVTESFSKRFVKTDDPQPYFGDGEGLFYAVLDVTACGTYHEVGGEEPGTTEIEFDFEVMFQYTLCRGLEPDGSIVCDVWSDLDYYEPNPYVLRSNDEAEAKARAWIEGFTAESVTWDGRPFPIGAMQ